MGGHLKRRMKDEIVEVIRSPEAPNLVGKRGIVVHKEGGWIAVEIEGRVTHFRKKDIRVLKDA